MKFAASVQNVAINYCKVKVRVKVKVICFIVYGFVIAVCSNCCTV